MADIPLKLPEIGNALMQGAHAAYYTGKARQEENAFQGEQAARPDIAAAIGGDQGAQGRVAQASPTTFAHIAPHIAKLDADKRAQAKAAADFTAHATNTLLQADPKDRAAVYQQMIDLGKAQGHDMSTLPPQYTPAFDTQARLLRGQSKDLLTLMQQQEMEAGRNARHNSPGGGTPPAMEPMNPAAGPRADAGPSPMAPPVSVAQAAPVAPTAPPSQMAQGAAPAAPSPSGEPQVVQGDSPGATPQITGPQVAMPPGTGPAPAAAPQQGAIWTVDPSTQGAQMMGHRAKPGAPLLPAEIAGHFVYKLPNGQTVLYKAQAPHQPPVGYETDPGKPGALRAIAGGPADKAGTEIDATLRGEDLFGSLAPSEAAQVKGVLEGRIPLPSLSARMAPEAKRLRQLAFQADPSFDGTVYAARAATQKDMADGKLAVQRTAADKLIAHMGELHEVSAELNNSSTPLFNKVGNLIASNRGDPRIAKFEATKHLVSEEATKFFSGTGGATVSGIEEMSKLINSAQSPQQLQGVMTQISKLMNGQIDAMAEQYNRGMRYTGDKAVKGESLLSKSAQDALAHIKENPLGGKPAGGGVNLKQLYGLE